MLGLRRKVNLGDSSTRFPQTKVQSLRDSKRLWHIFQVHVCMFYVDVSPRMMFNLTSILT